MVITIGALYVILPALYALVCVALAMRPVRIVEPAVKREVFALAVVECQRKALDALNRAKVQSTPVARRTWLDASLLYQRRAERYVQAMALLVPLLASASWADQCTAAVYDYAERMCYVEDADADNAVCSEFRYYLEPHEPQ